MENHLRAANHVATIILASIASYWIKVVHIYQLVCTNDCDQLKIEYAIYPINLLYRLLDNPVLPGGAWYTVIEVRK